MMVRARFFLLLTLAGAVAWAQRSMTAAELIAFVKSQIQMKGDDRATADFLAHKIRLTERLADRTVEELQGQGAGPKTVQALRKLSEESANLPVPPSPPAAAPAPPPIPPPDSIEQAEALRAIKEYALNYTNNLPNYVCVQTTRRKIEPTVRGYLPYGDVIQEQLSFFDHKESYKVQMINHQSVVNVDHNQLGGAVSSGEFGTMLSHIFDPETGADFSWDHWATLRGRRMYVFGFSVPKSAGYSMYHGETKREYISAYKGFIYADRETKAVMRIKMDCVGIPADYPIKEVGITLDYTPTQIAASEYVLPFHFELDSKDTKAVVKNEADYRLYRKFGTESTITFGDAEPIPEDQLKEQPAAPDAKDQAPVKKPQP
ncbi:MAG TPA: hypothetical protein VK419_07335 [Bryobacteraceae bacterium]|nr:hypothetical protein [Bryobacteraceae bacterium]